MKPVALPVVVRKHRKYGIQVHTQTRHVLNHKYDPLYDNTEETCGETAKDWESIIDTAIRGCKEEMGAPNLKIEKIIGGNGQTISTRPEKDLILEIPHPYCFVQQLVGPQPWLGLGFVVIVSDDFEPQQDAEKETSAHQWWDPGLLLKELHENPSKFMGLHYPVLLKVCRDIAEGNLKI